jgi:translation elongation factor EF-1alpha
MQDTVETGGQNVLQVQDTNPAGFNCVLHVHSAVEEVTFASLIHKLEPGTGRKSTNLSLESRHAVDRALR